MNNKDFGSYYVNTAIKIWRDHADENAGLPGAELMPLLLKEFQLQDYRPIHDQPKTDLLIVGMNPSVPEEQKSKLAWNSKLDEKAMLCCIDDVISSDAQARYNYKRFFDSLKRFAESVDTKSLAHVDLFLLRHTSQNEVLNAYGSTFKTLKPFASKQFELFRETLKFLAPNAVLIANKSASDIAREGLSLKTSDGGRSYAWEELPNVPFFLSGMLSGQRALDEYSRARLALDVREALHRNTA